MCHCERPKGAKQSQKRDCFVVASLLLAMTSLCYVSSTPDNSPITLSLRAAEVSEAISKERLLRCFVPPFVCKGRGFAPRNDIFYLNKALLMINDAKTIETMDINFIRMFKDGPEVSLNGSPTVSPTTAAL